VRSAHHPFSRRIMTPSIVPSPVRRRTRHSGRSGTLELIAGGEEIRAAWHQPCEAHIAGVRAAEYGRDEVAELTGCSHRTIDRQLG
jgi:hypothetical protein